MAEAVVASLRGDWKAVVQAVSNIFKEAEFILLAEAEFIPGEDATKQLHFRRASSLHESTRMPRGRAFNDEAEVRWRESCVDHFIITFLSESENVQPPPDFASGDMKWKTARRAQKLYGKWSKSMEDWVEVSVPGVTGRYKEVIQPEPDHLPLMIETVDYFVDGCIQLTRFCGVAKYARGGE
jgi:hypothetical protein